MTESRSSKRAVVVLLGLVAVGLLGYGGYRIFAGSAEAEGSVNGQLTYTVKRDDLIISFTERGSINAFRSQQITCQLEGTSKIVWIVPEGTEVKEGDLLVELDSSSLENELNQQQISTESAEAEHRQSLEELKIQESLNQSNIDAARLDVELAQIDFDRYRNGDFPQAVKNASNDILLAEEELARAQDKFEWTKRLALKEYVTRMDEQADALAVKRAQVQHEKATQAKLVLEEWTHKKDLRTYESALEQATAALERTESKARAELEKVKTTVKSSESKWQLSVKRLEKLTDQMSKTRIVAPQDGMVVYEAPDNFRGRDVVIEQGAEVWERQELMELPDVSVMAAEVRVHESWVDQVSEGLPALIGIDALPNLNLRGRVTKVGLLPEKASRWRNPDLKVYKTEVTIDESQDTQLLRPGMSANVRIVIARLSKVLFVPVQSVTTLDGQQVVYFLKGGDFEPRPIVAGRHNDSFVEVVSGVEEGDVIRLDAPSPQGKTQAEDTAALDVAEEERGPAPAARARRSEVDEAGGGRQFGASGAGGGQGRGMARPGGGADGESRGPGSRAGGGPGMGADGAGGPRGAGRAGGGAGSEGRGDRSGRRPRGGDGGSDGAPRGPRGGAGAEGPAGGAAPGTTESPASGSTP